MVITYDCKDPVDPVIARAVTHETEDERSDRNAQSDHQGPDTHVTGAVFLESRFHHDSATDGGGRGDEERNKSTTSSKRGIVSALGTANVTDQTADERKEENWPASIPVGKGLPEQRSTSQDGNLQRSQITGILDTDTKIFSNV